LQWRVVQVRSGWIWEEVFANGATKYFATVWWTWALGNV
jgi:hypothetical protein